MTIEELLKKLADAPKDATVRLSTCMDTERAVAVQIGLHGVVIEGEGVDETDEDEWCDYLLRRNLDTSPEEDESESA